MLLDTSINCSPYAYLVYESMHPLSLLMVIISMLYHWRYWSIATMTGYASQPSSSWSYICWWLTIITVPSEWILERIWYATGSCCTPQMGMVKWMFFHLRGKFSCYSSGVTMLITTHCLHQVQLCPFGKTAITQQQCFWHSVSYAWLPTTWSTCCWWSNFTLSVHLLCQSSPC